MVRATLHKLAQGESLAFAEAEAMMDAIAKGTSERKLVCRTFSDCTTAPRNGLPSGCYPLDEYYKGTPTAEKVKEIKSQL